MGEDKVILITAAISQARTEKKQLQPGPWSSAQTGQMLNKYSAEGVNTYSIPPLF